jgi:hypothetical protein
MELLDTIEIQCTQQNDCKIKLSDLKKAVGVTSSYQESKLKKDLIVLQEAGAVFVSKGDKYKNGKTIWHGELTSKLLNELPKKKLRLYLIVLIIKWRKAEYNPNSFLGFINKLDADIGEDIKEIKVWCKNGK